MTMMVLPISWMHLNISGQCFEARSLSQIEKVLFRLHLLRRTYWQLIAAGEKRLILLEGVSTGRIGSTCMDMWVEWSFLFCFLRINVVWNRKGGKV